MAAAFRVPRRKSQLMGLAKRIHNLTRRLLQAYGPEKVKSHLWDVEFAQGQWDCLDSTPNDCVYAFIEKYANQGSILDLGCGSGSTGNEVAVTAYGSYTGVDISGVAIGKAKERTEKTGRADKNRFFQSEISSYMPTQQFDVILFRDSIYYYVTSASIKTMLQRYSKHLKPSGVFIVRMANRDKHKSIVDIIASNFEVIEKHAPEQSDDVVLVFR
jgi:2-polyprenyl-3-methyl-5-hydroxy-6-metoxy-1,4-benzoquinol methylase